MNPHMDLGGGREEHLEDQPTGVRPKHALAICQGSGSEYGGD